MFVLTLNDRTIRQGDAGDVWEVLSALLKKARRDGADVEPNESAPLDPPCVFTVAMPGAITPDIYRFEEREVTAEDMADMESEAHLRDDWETVDWDAVQHEKEIRT